MSRSHTKWTDRLSDYIDGQLGTTEHAELEEHLGTCGECRTVLEELTSVRDAAAALSGLEPARDLWQGIEAVISAPAVSEAEVIELPTAQAAPVRDGFTFSAPQLVAATVALIAFSAATTAYVGPGVGTHTSPVASDVELPVTFVAQTAEPPPALAAELAELEGVLDAAREALDPNTVRILERNLEVIERAIDDSRRALEVDPGNEYLMQHLDRVYQRKLTYLRDTNRVIEWAG